MALSSSGASASLETVTLNSIATHLQIHLSHMHSRGCRTKSLSHRCLTAIGDVIRTRAPLGGMPGPRPRAARGESKNILVTGGYRTAVCPVPAGPGESALWRDGSTHRHRGAPRSSLQRGNGHVPAGPQARAAGRDDLRGPGGRLCRRRTSRARRAVQPTLALDLHRGGWHILPATRRPRPRPPIPGKHLPASPPAR